MKYTKIIFAALAAAAVWACQPEAEVPFGVEVESEDGKITVGPEGGVSSIDIKSSDNWVVETAEPWIMVSPANGKGNVHCQVSIDSTLVAVPRQGKVRVRTLGNDEVHDIEIAQKGFDYQIALSESYKEIEDFAVLSSRSFDIEVFANVDFNVELPAGAENWLSFKKSELDLDRGARPRKVNLHFEWKVNSREDKRTAAVQLVPLEEVKMGRHDTLKVVQKGALPIPVGAPKGDSLSILAISRALGMYTEWDTAEIMEHWNNVKLHKDGPNKGRVRYVQFFIFNTKEPLPYEVQNLTAAEEIVFFSNANQFLKSLDTGEYITKLTQLKRLTIGAYGLTSLHPDFKNLKNLEYLDIGSNCFESIPEMLTPENFPNLHSLVLGANQRYSIYDLSNDTREGIGGFIEDNLNTEKGRNRFKDLLKWEKLDTLRLSVNYLQGEIPDMMDEGLPVWTFEELKDSIAVKTVVDGKTVWKEATELPDKLQNLPKVLPNAKFFAVNFNRLTGKVPDWILYHPHLDFWTPYSLIFSQEGKNKEGKNAGFDNEPASLDYYYDIYYNKKYNPNKK